MKKRCIAILSAILIIASSTFALVNCGVEVSGASSSSSKSSSTQQSASVAESSSEESSSEESSSEESSSNESSSSESSSEESSSGPNVTTYVIRFNAGEGNVQGENEITYEEGDSLTFPTAKRHGYIFSGWYKGETLVDAEGWLADKQTVTLTAKYTQIQFQVKYQLSTTVKGKTVNLSVTGAEPSAAYHTTVAHGSTASAVATPTVLDDPSLSYQFKGWKVATKSDGEKWLTEISFDENVLDYTQTVLLIPVVAETPETDYYE